MNARKLWLTGIFCLTTFAAVAGPVTGKSLSVKFIPQAGDALTIGHVTFENDKLGYRYDLTIDESLFEKFFLNMAPFKCFQGPKHHLCHLPYLYEKGTHITAKDMLDLEYDFLFIHRKKTDYGIDPWNGLYYKMKITEKGIEGELREVDLNLLAAPPDKGVKRPITDYDLQEADPDVHSYPRMLIQ